MKIKLLVILFTVYCGVQSFAQDSLPAYQKYISDVAVYYGMISGSGTDNYFETLEKTARYCFNPYNKNYLPALYEVKSAYRMNEGHAVDTLFRMAMNTLRAKYLWKGNEDVIQKNKVLFDLYSDAVCGCVNPMVKRTDLSDKLNEAFKNCIASLATDTVFVRKIKGVAGGLTVNQLYNMQQFVVRHIYGACSILNQKWDELIYAVDIQPRYTMTVNGHMDYIQDNVIRFYKQKRFDSLAAIFPAYRNYLPEFEKIIKNNERKGITSSGHIKRGWYNEPVLYIISYEKKMPGSFVMLSDVEFTLSDYGTDAVIISLKTGPFKKTDEKLIEKIETIETSGQ